MSETEMITIAGDPANNKDTVTPPAEAPTETPGGSVDWTASLSPEVKGWVEKKGFKGADAVIESYRNLEKLMKAPKDRLLTLPEKEDDPSWNDVYARLGRPSEPTEYKLSGFEDDKFSEFSRKTFYELGLTKRQGEALAAKWKEYGDIQTSEREAAINARASQEESELKKEWGQAHDQNVNIAKRAITALGMDADTIDSMEKAMGYKKTMAVLHTVGLKLGEGSYVDGGTSANGALTPGAAQAQITELMSDPGFSHKYVNGDREARTQMERLHRMAYPSQG